MKCHRAAAKTWSPRSAAASVARLSMIQSTTAPWTASGQSGAVPGDAKPSFAPADFKDTLIRGHHNGIQVRLRTSIFTEQVQPAKYYDALEGDECLGLGSDLV